MLSAFNMRKIVPNNWWNLVLVLPRSPSPVPYGNQHMLSEAGLTRQTISSHGRVGAKTEQRLVFSPANDSEIMFTQFAPATIFVHAIASSHPPL